MLIFKKHFAVIFRCLSMGAFLLCVGILLYSRFGKGWRPLDLDLPEDTGVLIHSSTFTTSGKIELAPRSEIYFYDSTGSLLRDVSVSEEVCGDFIVDSGDDICFFFKNRSVIASVDSAISLGNHEFDYGMEQLKYLINKSKASFKFNMFQSPSWLLHKHQYFYQK